MAWPPSWHWQTISARDACDTITIYPTKIENID